MKRRPRRWTRTSCSTAARAGWTRKRPWPWWSTASARKCCRPCPWNSPWRRKAWSRSAWKEAWAEAMRSGARSFHAFAAIASHWCRDLRQPLTLRQCFAGFGRHVRASGRIPEQTGRIQAGQGFTKATVYVGQEIAFSYVPPNRRKGGMIGQAVSNAGYALSFPFCALIGFLCHAGDQLVQFLLAGLPDPNANIDVEMVKTAVTGFLLTVVVTHLLGCATRGCWCRNCWAWPAGCFSCTTSCISAAPLRTGVLADLGGPCHLGHRTAFDVLAGHQLSILTRMVASIRGRMVETLRLRRGPGHG